MTGHDHFQTSSTSSTNIGKMGKGHFVASVTNKGVSLWCYVGGDMKHKILDLSTELIR